jgi:Holliday junction resolvase
MSHYAKGTRFEHKVRDDLAENGYEVMRAAGSKGSTKLDLIALKPGEMLFVQCKTTGLISPAEWNRVYEVAGWVGAVPLLASNGPRGRGVTYGRLTGVKVPRSRTRPCVPWTPDLLAEAA